MNNTIAPPSRAALWLLTLLQASISGASLVVEIVAGRMIAPYVGMSLYTWTSVIAVVLAGFSVGHWWGGRIAALEKGRALRLTGWTMVGAALTTGGAAVVLREVAGPVLATWANPLSAITILTALVFFLPSLFAGVPAPVLAVVAMQGRDQPERALGAMFAAGAVGAIGGTLLAGFLFISWLGSAATLVVITAIYVISALLLFGLGGTAGLKQPNTIASLCAAVGLGAATLLLPATCDRESQYYCIRTVSLSDDPANPVRLMVIDHLAHGISGSQNPQEMYTEHAAMLDALARMRMPTDDFTSFHIGGGSYSVPRAWADRGIGGITVAEIDPAVTAQAIADFWFVPETARIIHQDARRTLAEDVRQYDVVIGDAFTDIAVPAHLVTREFFQLVSDRLSPRGVFAMNILDNTDRLDALASIIVTLRSVFPSVEVWTEARPPVRGERRIFVILASATDSPVSEISARSPEPRRFAVLEDRFIDGFVKRINAQVLTDNYAPIDRLMGFYPVTN